MTNAFSVCTNVEIQMEEGGGTCRDAFGGRSDREVRRIGLRACAFVLAEMRGPFLVGGSAVRERLESE